MKTPRFLTYLGALATLALALAFACDTPLKRNWDVCWEDRTDCRPGFSCDRNTWRCIPTPGTPDGGDTGGAGGGGTGGGGNFACNGSTDCHVSSLPACDLSTHTCVACVGNGDCSSGACDTDAHLCVECLASSSCTTPGKTTCDPARHTCVACLGNSNCAAPTPVCDTTVHACVGCLAKTDCAGTTPVCDVASQTCVGCTADTDCAGNKPVCDKATKTCVACSSDDACAAKSSATPVCGSAGACVACKALGDSKAHCTNAAAPVCDAATNSCRACKADAECATAYGANPGVCVAGQCQTDAQVIYVKTAATGAACNAADGSAAKPFCDIDKAAKSLAPDRSVLVVRGPSVGGGTLAFTQVPVVVVGQSSANLSSVGLSGVVTISAGDVTLRDLTISGNTAGPGVSATGGTLRMTRCQVLNNKSGIETAGAAFDITNTVVAGSTGSAAGVTLGDAKGATPTNFAFNTVVDNALGAGVACASGTSYTLHAVLLAGNNTSTSGTCTPDSASSTEPPLFSTSSRYHLTSSSPCVDKAGTTNLPPDDIDGDPRPQGAAADCGADEYVAH